MPRLEPFVKSITKYEDLVTEAIQETFVSIWMNRERMAAIEFPKTYIFKMAAYISFQHLKRMAKSRGIVNELTQVTQFSSTSEERIGILDLEKIIKAAIAQLTPAQQRIYKLSREEGLKIPEIAATLGISSNTVKNTLVASLKTIRSHTERAGYKLGILVLWLFS